MSEEIINQDSFKSTDEIWISDNQDDSQDILDLEKDYSNEMEEESFEEIVTNRPRVSLIGRPNVGKSTLINRIIGRREAVVQDIPGVTKDRVYYDAQWDGKEFILIDTGGWTQDSSEMMNQIATQVQKAIDESDLILFVLDFQVGITQEDQDVIKLIRKTKTPVLLVANKVDGAEAENQIGELWSLGLGEPIPVSALHGRGSGELLEKIKDNLPIESKFRDTKKGPVKVAIIGKPNVGKSSLLNKLSKSNRSIVSEISGTTVDPVDEIINLNGQDWHFIDTAGIRKRFKESSGFEYYATLRTSATLERSEIILLVIESDQVIADQDRRLISQIIESGKALVLVFNKWDLIDEERHNELEREIETDLRNVSWAPRVNLSAKTGWHIDKISKALNVAYEGWTTRISTGKLNQFVKEFVAANPHPLRGGKQSKILFATQIADRPPTFALFTTGALDLTYQRHLERKLRQQYGFEGSPIHIKVKIRQRKR